MQELAFVTHRVGWLICNLPLRKVNDMITTMESHLHVIQYYLIFFTFQEHLLVETVR